MICLVVGVGVEMVVVKDRVVVFVFGRERANTRTEFWTQRRGRD